VILAAVLCRRLQFWAKSRKISAGSPKAWKIKMSHRIVAAVFLVTLFVAGRCCAQTEGTAQGAPSASQTTSAQKILSKDLDYLLLLNPPADEDFLKSYSQGYREKKAEIEAKAANISDEKLRSDVRNDEWSNVSKKDLDKFKAEADKSYYEAKIAFLQKHPGAWFEVGRAAYDENAHSLVVTETPAAAIAGNFRVAMNRATIDQIYAKLHQIAGNEIDAKAHDYVSKAGAGSMCSRNPELCYKLTREDMEKSARAARMVVVAQADFEARRIDRLLLVDYETEAVLQELEPRIPAPYRADWRFSPELPPAPPPEPQPSPVQAQAVPPAPADAEPSADQSKHAADNGSTGAPEPNSQPAATAAAKPIPIPADVIAASILSHPAPVYPPRARATHVQGEVVLHAIIDKEGKISPVQVLSGDGLLSPAAVDAVRQWRYKPILVDGEPIEVDTTITITFSLTD
jgi:TonB family protein